MSLSTSPPASENIDATKRLRIPRLLEAELRYLAGVYFVTMMVGSLFVGACAPGCCFYFCSFTALVSGILMLREPFMSRCVCLGILALSLVGMWHEKDVETVWTRRNMQEHIEKLREELQKSRSTNGAPSRS